MSNTDPGLSIKGKRQVDALLLELNANFDSALVLSSPSRRTMETAKIISHGKQFICVNELHERDVGTWEGLNTLEIRQRRKAEGLSLVDVTQDWIGCSDVEQDKSVWMRSWSAIIEHSRNASVDTVIIVTHAGVIKSIVYQLLRIDPMRYLAFRVTLGGMLLFELRNGEYELQKLWPNPNANMPQIL